VFYLLGVFLFANCANSFLTNVGKVAVGRLRPHFIPSCFNKFSYSEFCQYPNEWRVNYTCLGESSDSVKDKDGAYDIRYVVKPCIYRFLIAACHCIVYDQILTFIFIEGSKVIFTTSLRQRTVN
jgi:hypothetical protein